MLHLASRSPRRRQLLAALDVDFALLDAEVPEIRAPGESAAAYVARVARDKAAAGLSQVADCSGAWVLGADTEVVLADEVFGKPDDAAAAAAMLRRLSGKTHTVLSAVWLLSERRVLHALSSSQVRFAALDAQAIDWYIGSGEWQGKAGGYAIQGRAQALIAHLAGSHSGVMGLPLHETRTLLLQAGLLGVGTDRATASRQALEQA